MSERSTITPTDSAYSAVFLLAQESLKAGAPGLTADIQNAIARSVALKLVGRKLAPAAYGDKRQPYHSGACIGIVGMSVNLRFSDNSAEFVFHEEDLELINEEGRDLYFIRFPTSEILALRQALIDYLPASETDGAGAAPDLRADREALRKALTEITAAADKMILSLPGHWHDDATIELTDAAGDARAALSAAAQNDLYDVSSDAAPTGSGNASEAARDVIAENADCRRPAVACGAGGTGTGGCGCMLAADAVLRLAASATEAARG